MAELGQLLPVEELVQDVEELPSSKSRFRLASKASMPTVSNGFKH